MDVIAPFRENTNTDTSGILFRKLFDESRDILVIFDFELDKAVDVNEATLKFTGYTREEFLKLSREELTPQHSIYNTKENLHDTYLKDHADKIIKGEAIKEAGIFCKKDGTEVLTELDIIPTGRKKGEAFIIVKDITEQVEKKSKYEESERNYKSIVESTSAGITINDLEGNHIYVSPQLKQITGYSPEEMLKMQTFEFFRHSSLKKLKKFSRNLLKGDKTSKSGILEAIHKDGHSVWLQGTGALIKNKSGDPIALQTVFIDISDNILLKEELKSTRDKYQQIIENLEGIFMVVDLEGNIEYVSPNYTSVTGYQTTDVIGKKVFSF